MNRPNKHQTAQTNEAPASETLPRARTAKTITGHSLMHTAISRLDNALIERAVSEPETPEQQLISWRARMAFTMKTNLNTKKAGRR